ncbi:MAG: ATP-binding protein [Acidobacteriota bacterium]
MDDVRQSSADPVGVPATPKERLRLLESAVEQASDAILICSSGTETPTRPEVVYVNPAFTRMSGYGPEEILGKSPFLLGGPDSDPQRDVEVFNELTGGRTLKGEMVAYAKDRTEFIMEWQVVPLRDESGAVTHLLAIQRDITEHRRLETQLRQSQKMEAVGRLAGGVAHDFNNLLTAIIGYNQLLLLALGTDHPQREAVEQIGKAAKRAATLTSQLLAFSRRQVLQPKVIDLNEVVRGIEKILRRLIGEDIDLLIELEPLAAKVKADPGQLEQVILNLAINARDAMPDGGHLLVETDEVELDDDAAREHETESGAYVRLRVRDSGLGMDTETQAKIFEPFFTTKGQEKGTGLGLATVYGIVKQSGGFIGVDSTTGKGTIFDVFLPRIENQPVQPIDRSYSAKVERGDERVLLAEDDDSVRRLVSTVLTENGYEVLEAADGSEALDIAADLTLAIDLLISDVVMPDMRGPELCRRVLAGRPDMRTLFISGYADGSSPHRGEFGADVPFLQKPFSPEALARKVREVLDQPRSTVGEPYPDPRLVKKS